MRIKRRIAVFASMGDVMSRSSLVLRGACASLLLMMVAACGHSSPVSEDAAGNGGDGSNPSGSLVSSQNTFLSIVPPGSNGNSAGGIGAPVPGVPTLSYPRSEEHTSELQSLMRISYAVFCLKKKKTTK